jgi:RNA polymerase sigma-70 factor (ECF subfamily)
MPLNEEQRSGLEDEARDACARGDYARAATIAVRGYGPEVFGLIASLHRDPDDAADVFARFTEALWTSLPSFGWASSLRTWLYGIARNVSHRARRTAARQGKRQRRASNSELDAIANRVRTETLTFLKTEKRTRVQQLRESLDAEDQMILVLRIDRGLSWNELARIMSEDDLAEADVTREAARLRKRFQLVKEQLAAATQRQALRDKG